jgi:nuclear transport factor 2 (NTF2) superfamily protein
MRVNMRLSWIGARRQEQSLAATADRSHAGTNDLPIAPAARLFHWPLGRRPDDHPGLSELGL